MTRPWIVIPTYNGRSWLEVSLPSLLATIPRDTPVLVVDNGSTDGTRAWLAAEFPHIHTRALERNLGFASACNLGILHACRHEADSVLLLNNDMRFTNGWWEELLESLDHHPEFAILGMAQNDFNGHPSPRTQVEFQRRTQAFGNESAPTVVSTDWVEGSCLLLRRGVIDAIGFFDPLFSPAYFEEIDFCRRARQKGLQVGIVLSPSIEHAGAGTKNNSTTMLRERNYYLYHASAAKYPGWDILKRACRHGLKEIRAGKINGHNELRAVRESLSLLTPLRAKYRRDKAGHVCPAEGTSLPSSPLQQSLEKELRKFREEKDVTLPKDYSFEHAATVPQATVVIPVRERTMDLAICLDHVLAQRIELGSFEVVVCDDGSSPDGSARIVDLCKRDARVRYVRQQHKGPAAARNLGVREAKAPIIVFTDSDTLPQPGWLESILEPFQNAGVIAVEGPVRPPAPSTSPMEEAPRNEGGVHLTANMAYRRDVLFKIGGLDESFPMPAFEDVDLALSAQRFGRIEFASRALVLHPWRRVTLASSLRRLRHLDWLIVTAERHGCLGWINRPTKYPRWRVARAALVTLPVGRIRKSLGFLRLNTRDALTRIGISLVEMLVAWRHLPRWITQPAAPLRQHYLQGEMP